MEIHIQEKFRTIYLPLTGKEYLLIKTEISMKEALNQVYEKGKELCIIKLEKLANMLEVGRIIKRKDKDPKF